MAKPISVQLYSVREACEQDFPGTLKKISDFGYVGVETAGYHGFKPAEVAKMVKDLGMKVSSCHGSLATKENLSEIVEEQQALGNTMLISGFGPDAMDTEDKAKAVAEQLQTSAQLLKPYGIRFGMHNHWWEFTNKINGRYAFDLLMEFAPDMFSQLDTYWSTFAKADTVEVIKTYKSRMPILHIKDGSLQENVPHTAVGKGVLNFPSIIGAADPAVLEWLVVELDECATDMLQAVKDSCDFLTSTGLAQGRK